MTMPKAYEPVQGQMYQLLQWDDYNREYDHLDYAKDSAEKKYLLEEYRMAHGAGVRFKTIKLPQKYWDSNEKMVYYYDGLRYEKYPKNGTVNIYRDDTEVDMFTNYEIGNDYKKFIDACKSHEEYMKHAHG